MIAGFLYMIIVAMVFTVSKRW